MTFHQVLDPLQSIAGDTLLALVPVVILLVLLGVFRMSPAGSVFSAYGLGAATGVWSIDWIVL